MAMEKNTYNLVSEKSRCYDSIHIFKNDYKKDCQGPHKKYLCMEARERIFSLIFQNFKILPYNNLKNLSTAMGTSDENVPWESCVAAALSVYDHGST